MNTRSKEDLFTLNEVTDDLDNYELVALINYMWVRNSAKRSTMNAWRKKRGLPVDSFIAPIVTKQD